MNENSPFMKFITRILIHIDLNKEFLTCEKVGSRVKYQYAANCINDYRFFINLVSLIIRMNLSYALSERRQVSRKSRSTLWTEHQLYLKILSAHTE